MDQASDKDGKEFYTFTSPAGNQFFLIIDKQRSDNNVYFLDYVTEKDLISLAKKDKENPLITEAPEPENKQPEPEIKEEKPEEKPVEETKNVKGTSAKTDVPYLPNKSECVPVLEAVRISCDLFTA